MLNVGTYNLTVIARDFADNVNRTTNITITLMASVNPAPHINFSAPTPDNNFNALITSHILINVSLTQASNLT